MNKCLSLEARIIAHKLLNIFYCINKNLSTLEKGEMACLIEPIIFKIIDKEDNGLVKAITVISRCEKSYLLNNILYNCLVSIQNAKSDRIIRYAFENEE